MINRINIKKWNNIINNYYTNYYDNESTRIRRRNQRALYLSNIEYLKMNKFNTSSNIKTISYNKWYLDNYNNINNI